MKCDDRDGLQRIGDLARDRRKALGFTQSEEAILVNWNQAGISKLERGERVPMPRLFGTLADLGVPPNEVASRAGWWTAPPNGGAAIEPRPQI
jgi:transcriptional regulator with XRE-family HTH domain